MFAKVLAEAAVGGTTRLFLMPVGDSIRLHTPDSLNSLARQWFTYVTFGPRLEVDLHGNQVQPCPPVYETDELSEALNSGKRLHSQ
jgi:hypothetical protein